MATARLIPSTYAVSNNTVTVSNASNMYANVDSTNYATITHTTAGTTSYYLYLRGFDFDAVPSNATVNSITVKVRGYESGLSTSTSYAPRLYNSTSTISGASAASENFNTTAKTITVPYTGTWSTLNGYGSNLGIRLTVRRSNRNTQGYLYIYGAEITVDYTAATVNVTGVTLDKNTISLEEGETEQLTETVAPSNATDKSVTWTSSNTSVATVDSNGLVTAVSAGSATITVKTNDGNKTAACAVTVTAPVLTQYRLTDTMVAGKSYLISNGNSGSVYLLSNEANGSRTLKGVAATVTDGIVSINGATAAKCLFACVETSAGNPVTTGLTIDGKYLYCDNANGLRMNTVTTLDRFWHYQNTKFWQFKNSSSNGYSDTTSEYKYYLTWSNGNATDSHVDTAGIENSTLPPAYLYEEYTPPTDKLYVKLNGSWVAVNSAYVKQNGAWVQTDISQVFQSGVNYVKGN